MRIAFVVNDFPLVSETFILEQIQGAMARGHAVDIYAVPVDGAGRRHPRYLDWKMAERLRPRLKLGGAAASLRTLAGPVLRRPALLWRCLRQCVREGVGNPLVLFAAAYGIEPAPQAYDVIHAHFADSGLLAVRLRTLGVLAGPVLTSFHGADVTRRRSARSRAGLQKLFTEGDAFTYTTAYIAARAQELGCPADRQIKLLMGVDFKSFRFRERAMPQPRPVRLLTIARLVEKKGIEYAIRAVHQLVASGYDVQYTVVGEGPVRAALQALLGEELKIEAQVNLLGARSGDEVRRILDETDIFVLPSVTAADGDTEGLGVVNVEAQAAGIPVVSTDSNGIPEGVDAGRSAFLVPERDAGALAERLGFLIDHPETWAAMGRAGRAHVERHFDIEKLNDELIEIYQSLGAAIPSSAVAT